MLFFSTFVVVVGWWKVHGVPAAVNLTSSGPVEKCKTLDLVQFVPYQIPEWPFAWRCTSFGSG
jgi:hypothetical protein